MEEHEILDLMKHARNRVREVMRLKLQLVDSEEEAASVMLGTAVDLICGAQIALRGKDGITPEQAWEAVIEKVLAALIQYRQKAKPRKKSRGVDSTTRQE